MQDKFRLRKKYYLIRKKKYFDVGTNFFNPLIRLILDKYKKKLFIYLDITLHLLR